jgi:hypothetical protein
MLLVLVLWWKVRKSGTTYLLWMKRNIVVKKGDITDRMPIMLQDQ